jgi:hypothetical protein
MIMWRVLFFALCVVLAREACAQNIFTDDVQMCSGHPWIDVRCNGALGDGSHDDTSAINTTLSAAITSSVPVYFPAGTYKVTSKITADYQGISGNGLHIISAGATLDGRTIASGNVLQFICSGGAVGSPAVCNHLGIAGPFAVSGNGAGYVVVFGKTDFSDQHNAAHIEHIVATNNGTGGAIQANYLTDGDLWLSGSTAGGSASVGAVALEQVQSSRIGGWGSATGASAPALLLENAASVGNSFAGFSYDPNTSACVSITTAAAMRNAWIAPYFPCTTAINAPTNPTQNSFIGPGFAGTNAGPTSAGVAIVGRGSLSRYAAPAVASRSLIGTDDGTIFSAANATGPSTAFTAASLPITLPDPAQVGPGWSAGFVNDNSKAVVLNTSAGAIVSGGSVLNTMTLGPNNYEVVVLKSDGANFRVEFSSPATAVMNGVAPPGVPSRWVFPGGPGYQTTFLDNAEVVSASHTSGGLAVTLPQTTAVPVGWVVGISADGKSASVQVNSTNGGNLYLPGGAVAPSPYSMTANQGFLLWVQFDGVNFRILPSVGLPPTGKWSTDQGAAIARLGDRLFVGKNTNVNDGNVEPNTVSKDWAETTWPNSTSNAMIPALAQAGGIGVMGGVRTSDGASGSYGIGTSGFCLNDITINIPSPTACAAGYFETVHPVGANGANYSHGIEINIDEMNSGTVNNVIFPVHYQPYTSPFPNGLSDALRLASGGVRPGAQPATDAIAIINNGAPFRAGIVFQQNSIYGTGGVGGQGEAIAMAMGHQINWYSPDGLINTTLTNSGGIGSTPSTVYFGAGNIGLSSTAAASITLTSSASGGGGGGLMPATPPANQAIIYFTNGSAGKYGFGLDGTGNNLILSDLLTSRNTITLISGNLTIGETAATTIINSAFKFGSAVNWTTNGSVATTLTSLGPAGAHATVQEWLTIVDNNNVVRYVPVY